MFNQPARNSGVVAGNVEQALISLRNSAYGALRVLQWVTDQTHDDLVAIGFSAADATALQTLAADMVGLLAMMSGGPPAEQKDYLAEARPFIGPNQ